MRIPFHLMLAGICLLAATHAPLALAQQAKPKPFYTEAADCTAAFQSRVVGRLAQPRTEARDTAILRDTEFGFIFIGVAYKEGLRSPEAEQMLKAAEKRWGQLGKPEQDSRLATCANRAQDLMDEVTFIERYLVKNRAKSRVDRLLEKDGKS
jgi:hypothetical protein